MALNYTDTSFTVNIDLANLASSSTFVAGAESAEQDNTSNKYDQVWLYPIFSVGTTPTLPCQLNIYLWGSDVSLAGKAIDTLDGTGSAETLTNTTVLLNSLVPAKSCSILVNTSDIQYPVAGFEVGAFFGGFVPPFWGSFVAHNMTAALRNNAVNTNVWKAIGRKYTT